MIGLVFTAVSQTDEQVRAALDAARAASGTEPGDYFISSPASTRTPTLDEMIGTEPASVSPFIPLEHGSLDDVVFAHPLRFFRDAYGEAMIAHYHNAVREGGWVALPFVEGRHAQGEHGVWTLQWLRDHIGRETRVLKKERIAIFTRTDAMLPPHSVLTAFLDDLPGLSRAFMSERATATNPEFLETCASFLPAEGRPIGTAAAQAATAQLPDVAEGIEKFLAYATYSVTGVSYKTEALRRFIAAYVPRKFGIRTLDIGGGIGLVDIELLLTHPGVERATICEPVPATLPITRRLVERYSRQLGGRLRMVIRPAQEYAFDEPVDVVSDFASLLYMPREDLGPTLNRAWAALRPGGIFVIHENIKRDIFKSKSYYEQVFEIDELDSALGRFGAVERFRSSDMAPITRERAGDNTVFRVVHKPA